MNECLAHDRWMFEEKCTCSPERKWARQKMLEEAIEKLAGSAKGATLAHPNGTSQLGKEV